MGNASKALLVIVGVPLGLFAALFLYYFVQELSNPPDPVERLKVGCQREFGYRGEEAVNDCVIKNMIRESREIQQRKLDAARR